MTPQTAEFISMAASLPIDIRLEIIDQLLESIGPSKKQIDDQWLTIARRRSSELKSGQVKAIPGEEVLAKIKERFGG